MMKTTEAKSRNCNNNEGRFIDLFFCDEVLNVISNNTDINKNLLKMRLIENKTFEQIGDNFQISSERARLIFNKGFNTFCKKLKDLVIHKDLIASNKDILINEVPEFKGILEKKLRALEIMTIGGLAQYSRKELLQFRSMGPTSLEIIELALKQYGYELKD